MTRIRILAFLAFVLCAVQLSAQDNKKENKVVLAYVISRQDPLPDPRYITHINYAFGHVNETFDGVNIENPRLLKKIARLKRRHPHLKVMLSIGGWGSGRFSEMAADSLNRAAFAADCKKVVRKYRLDGIDIDWEYPTSSAANISSSPEDTQNYTLMMRDLRSALGPDKILSQATVCAAKYIDFKAVDPYVNYTSAMTYDLGWAPYLNSPLYPSDLLQPESMSASEGIEQHLAAGVPPEKLVMGLAFYGRGVKGFPRRQDLTKLHQLEGYRYHWDRYAMNPYLTDAATGEFAFGYENEVSLAVKVQYALDRGLLGVMYWQYGGDNEEGDLRRTVYETLFQTTVEERR